MAPPSDAQLLELIPPLLQAINCPIPAPELVTNILRQSENVCPISKQAAQPDICDFGHLFSEDSSCPVRTVKACRTTTTVSHYERCYQVERFPARLPIAQLGELLNGTIHGHPARDYVLDIKPCVDDEDYGTDSSRVLVTWKDEWLLESGLSVQHHVRPFWVSFLLDFVKTVGCSSNQILHPSHGVWTGERVWTAECFESISDDGLTEEVTVIRHWGRTCVDPDEAVVEAIMNHAQLKAVDSYHTTRSGLKWKRMIE